jgi:hypothetical protein
MRRGKQGEPAAARHGQIRIVDEKAGIVSRLGAGARAKSALLYPVS